MGPRPSPDSFPTGVHWNHPRTTNGKKYMNTFGAITAVMQEGGNLMKGPIALYAINLEERGERTYEDTPVLTWKLALD